MRKGLKILGVLIFSVTFSAGNLLAQDETNTEIKADTIVLLGGRKVLCEIKGISSRNVSYKEIGGTEILRKERKQIQRVVFHNGRKEVFNKPIFAMVDDNAWQSIFLTENPDDVIGLYELGEVDGVSPKGSRNAKAAKKSAEIRVQKKAANLGAIMVLLTNVERKGGYGEIPSYVITGMAYGYEPPKEDEQ